ncbi:MAG TPA: inositol monophosphatase family protein [Paludibacter sp.]|nr:MAG: Inositol-1-monophosphatase [Bacteroidetes bacterium ADurb.Bin174]HQB28704.1 inositol monophosphatase family protein [Paludibacter sp.]
MSYSILCKQTCEIAKKAGNFISEQKKGFNQSFVEYKGLHDLVSYVDRETEKLVIAELQKLLPESGFIAEEGTHNVRGAKYNWIIDPLDGTTNFIQGIPNYAVSIALMENDDIVLGVVYEIGQQECFYAWKGGGAHLDGVKIQVSDKSDLNTSLIATGFPYTKFDLLDPYLAFLKWVMQNSRGVRRIGSAATDLAYVACGRFDAFWEYGLKSWDMAAGALLIQEAGGMITNFDGEEDFLFGGNVVATNGTLHPVFLRTLKDFIS